MLRVDVTIGLLAVSALFPRVANRGALPHQERAHPAAGGFAAVQPELAGWSAIDTGQDRQIAAGRDSSLLTLDAAVRAVLSTYPGALAAHADIDRSEAGLRGLRSARLPRLSIEAVGTRFQEPMIVAPLHGFDPQAPPGFDRFLVQGRAQAAWTLFDGGARSARIAAGLASVDVATASSDGTDAALIERVVNAYVEVAAAREIVAANDTRVSALAEERTRVGRMLAAGSVPQVAVLRADAALASARADAATAGADLRRAEADLARLIGVSADSVSVMGLQAVSLAQGVAQPDRRSLLTAATEGNSGVDRARAGLAAAEAGIAEARAAWWPALTLNGGYNTFGSAAGDFVGEWQAALQLAYPIFTGGARAAALDRSHAEAEAARAMLEVARLDAEAAIDAALARLTAARSSVEALTTAVDQFAAVADVEALSLEAGAGVQTEYLRATSDLLDARAALTRARAGEVAARVSLARIAGQLAPTWLVRNLEVQ